MSWPISRNVTQGLSTWRVRPSVLPRHVLVTRPYTVNYESKYADKLRQKAQQEGLSISELKAKAKEEEARRKKRIEETASLKATKPQIPTGKTQPPSAPTSPTIKERKDSSPVKPLSTILNIPRILSSPHTPEKVSALWNAYHISRSGGTGRGYICATIPADLYHKMMKVAKRYPSFVVPLTRTIDASAEPLESQDESNTAYEFHYLQWDFHDSPPVPTATEDPFMNPSQQLTPSQNPSMSTILFTPLQEYKLRNSFATPYLVLTQYTDLVSTHGIVLLRGEITPSSAGTTSGLNFMLSQEDAQRLCMTVQKFYLWNADSIEGKANESLESKLLRTFHEKPGDFKWEELLQTADSSI